MYVPVRAGASEYWTSQIWRVIDGVPWLWNANPQQGRPEKTWQDCHVTRKSCCRKETENTVVGGGDVCILLSVLYV